MLTIDQCNWHKPNNSSEYFKQRLEEVSLSRKQFKELARVSEGMFSRWINGYSPVPDWVFSWLDLYIAYRRLGGSKF